MAKIIIPGNSWLSVSGKEYSLSREKRNPLNNGLRNFLFWVFICGRPGKYFSGLLIKGKQRHVCYQCTNKEESHCGGPFKGVDYIVVMYPENNPYLYLSGVYFYNIGSLLRKNPHNVTILCLNRQAIFPSLSPHLKSKTCLVRYYFFASSLNPETEIPKLPCQSPPNTCPAEIFKA